MNVSEERWWLAGLLTLTLALRALHADQPIVEGYVGRQIPTAMVARNLDRGSGFWHPQLDTEPSPNLFLVEPPIYAAMVVGLKRVIGLGLDPAGRLTSALMFALGGWGLHGLVRRRDGTAAALGAVAAFALFPITIRYGRAFQPDATAIGLVVAALRCWDDAEADGSRGKLALGVTLLALGLAMKVTFAYVLLPLLFAIIRPGQRPKLMRTLAIASLLPACIWYVHAARLLGSGEGSRASADNGAIWLRSLVPTAWLSASTYRTAFVNLFVRGFTPLGSALAVAGIVGSDGRLLRSWALAAALAMGVLATKAHHEYYWLAFAPPFAWGVGRMLAGRRPSVAVAAWVALAALAAVLARPTWRTPVEWADLGATAAAVRATVPVGVWVVAPEALLYEADRKGCRLEFEPGSQRRAAGEWGATIAVDDPYALVEFYRGCGARYLADTGPDSGPGRERRRALRATARRRAKVIVDRPGVFLAELVGPTGGPNGAEHAPTRAARDGPRLRPMEGERPQGRRPDGL